MKIGKREKIVLGVIAGVASIAAVHFLTFEGAAKRLELAKNDANKAIGDASAIPDLLPTKDSVDAFEKTITSAEQIFWRAVFDLGVQPMPCFDPIVTLTPEQWAYQKEPQSVTDPEVRKKMEEFFKVYTPLQKGRQAAAEGIVLAHLDRLVKMKKAFEAGEPWEAPLLDTNKLSTATLGLGNADKLSSATLGLSADATSSGTLAGAATPAVDDKAVTKLSFLELTQDGWNVPTKLDATYESDPSKMESQVCKLFDAWNASMQMSPYAAAADQLRVKTDYKQQQQALGLNFPQYQYTQDKTCKELPAFNRYLLAKLIWEKSVQKEKLLLRANKPFTFDLLKEMLEVRLPEFSTLRNFERQLTMLDILLPLARKDGVEDVIFVKCFAPKVLMETSIKPTPVAAVATVPGAGGPPPGAGGPPSGFPSAGGPPGAGGFSSAATGAAASTASAGKATLSLVQVQFVASNASAIRYLCDIVNRPEFFQIDEMKIELISRQDKVRVLFTVDSPLTIKGISDPADGVANPGTGIPLALGAPAAGPAGAGAAPATTAATPVAWQPYWNARMLEESSKNGLNRQEIVTKAFAAAGYDATKPTPTPSATPATAAVGPRPGGGAPGGAPTGGAPGTGGGAGAAGGGRPGMGAE
jgi:hypothetical protein